MKKLFLILVNIFFIFNISFATEISGLVEVIDGDTIKINERKIRLFGIDAPEKNQICKKNWLAISFFYFI
jgi:Micrococcal nuclease (thermonuclease) homologs